MRTVTQPPASPDQQIDVLVIGGGPAGTTAATLLRQRGWTVVLLEKDQHPRFHIGESLLPMNIPILDRLGVLEDLDAIGVKKLGADFTCGVEADEQYRTYHFSRALGTSGEHAFEVRRQDFDHLLFKNCIKAGVSAFENHKVDSVSLNENGDRHLVESVDGDGQRHQWHPRYVLDASGRDTVLASKNQWKQKNNRHASAAIFGHFKGVSRRPGADAGNISIYWMPHGWIWMIPLPNDVMSVGAVCWPDYLKSRKGDALEFLRRTIALSQGASARLDGAQLINEVRVTGNYSYRSRKISGDGYALIGDAFAFVDPMFSSGVYLAMNSAESAVSMVENWLEHQPLRYRLARSRYERRIKKGVRYYSWFIYRFTSPAMRRLFRNPKNVLQVEQAVVSMLAGDVFSNRQVQLRLLLFRMIYRISWLASARDSLKARRKRLSNPDHEFA